MMNRYKCLTLCIFFLFYSCGDESSNKNVVDAFSEINSSEQDELNSSSSTANSAKKESSSSEKPKDSSSSKIQSSSSVKLEESSSSDNKSSSSIIECSSSNIEATGICKTELEDHCTYGSLYDERDGQTYKTVKIGEQWWMAENLRYEDAESSACYADDIDNCLIYGRLYNRAGALSDCPNEWHLPTEKDWLKLKQFVKENSEREYVGRELRADSLWDITGLGMGYDSYGFGALPGGANEPVSNWWGISKNAFFWLSDSYKAGTIDCYAYTRIHHKKYTESSYSDGSDLTIGKSSKVCVQYSSSMYSVRCIKD